MCASTLPAGTTTRPRRASGRTVEWLSTSRPRRAIYEPIGDLSDTAAPLADAGMTPMHAINGARQHLTPGSTTVAIGLGGLGHIRLQILVATSATRVIALDTDE